MYMYMYMCMYTQVAEGFFTIGGVPIELPVSTAECWMLTIGAQVDTYLYM